MPAMSPGSASYPIGDIAQRVGMTPRTIRYYEDIGLLEDARFVAALVNGGYKLATTQCATRDCLHWVHPASTARTIAGYRIPTFLLPELFPLCAELDAAHPLPAATPSPSQPGAVG